jgi:hypothetical protein
MTTPDEIECGVCVSSCRRPDCRSTRSLIGRTRLGQNDFKVYRCSCCGTDCIVGPLNSQHTPDTAPPRE